MCIRDRYDADGVGLAAPQVGKSIRMFVVDASPWAEEEPELADFKKTFINAEIYERFGDEWRFSEGCLSPVSYTHLDVYKRQFLRLYNMAWLLTLYMRTNNTSLKNG